MGQNRPPERGCKYLRSRPEQVRFQRTELLIQVSGTFFNHMLLRSRPSLYLLPFFLFCSTCRNIRALGFHTGLW